MPLMEAELKIEHPPIKKKSIKAYAEEEIGAAATLCSTSSHRPEMLSACGLIGQRRTSTGGGGCQLGMASM